MCAAPASAYRSWKAHDGTTVANSVKADVAIPNVSEATLKTRFYLDHFFSESEYDSNQNPIPATAGFVGGCVIGSDNYYMHAESRRWTARLRHPTTGQLVQLFNDAGLNTLGIGIINSVAYKWANNLGINSLVRSAYYHNTSNVGLRYRKTSGGAWTTHMLGENIPQGNEVTALRHAWPTFNQGDSVEVQVVVVNPEGTYYSPSTVITMDANVWSYGTLKRSVACSDVGQTGVIVWVREDQWGNIGSVTNADANTGIFLYTDVTMSTRVGSGWYFGLDGIKSFQVNSNGEIRRYENCVASPPVVTLFYEASIGDLYTFKAKLSAVYSGNVTVTARVDISNFVTGQAKYISITIPSGQTEVSEGLGRDLSDGDYSIYDANVTPALPLTVVPLM